MEYIDWMLMIALNNVDIELSKDETISLARFTAHLDICIRTNIRVLEISKGSNNEINELKKLLN